MKARSKQILILAAFGILLSGCSEQENSASLKEIQDLQAADQTKEGTSREQTKENASQEQTETASSFAEKATETEGVGDIDIDLTQMRRHVVSWVWNLSGTESMYIRRTIRRVARRSQSQVLWSSMKETGIQGITLSVTMYLQKNKDYGKSKPEDCAGRLRFLRRERK